MGRITRPGYSDHCYHAFDEDARGNVHHAFINRVAMIDRIGFPAVDPLFASGWSQHIGPNPELGSGP